MRCFSARPFFCYLVFLIFSLLCTSCASTLNPTERMQHLVLGTDFHYGIIRTKDFDLVTYSRIEPGAENLTIYIEGDGQAWRSRSKVSFDPTPHNPLGFMLAALDTVPSVVYLARPCQFVGGTEARNCEVSCWTSGRFSKRNVQAINEAISQVKQQAKAKNIHLVGYSGGGAIALLIAGQRDDVLSVRTVAGNLDHKKWTELQGVTPLEGSLNAKEYAQDLCTLPQMHYIGGKDSIMPQDIAFSYLRAVGENCQTAIEIIPDCTHSEGWTSIWPELCSNFNSTFGKER
ncbi:alpha/beta hydrolase [Marinifilum sp. JC120]|nr:alpha/beta hydrolase [Marinifilum sp. JC120]